MPRQPFICPGQFQITGRVVQQVLPFDQPAEQQAHISQFFHDSAC
ncbi:hypothetical protein [Xenorhabdus lircayensis]|nr:hypothetical protein [Xenorhabdus lircayensis]